MRLSPHISDVAVTARRVGSVTSFIAFVVPTREARADDFDELHRLITGKLPKFMHPARIFPVASLPRLPSGKTDFSAVKKFDYLLDISAGEQAPSRTSTALDDVLAIVEQGWRVILGSATLPSNIRFHDAGGDSLGLLQLIFFLERRLGCSLSLDFICDDMRIADMAA